MARDVSYPMRDCIEGQTVFFLRLKYRPENGGGESVRGPYMKRPAIRKYYAQCNIEAIIEEYLIVKKPITMQGNEKNI